MAGKVAQWGKAPSDKPEEPSSVPGIHTVKGENQLLNVFLSCPRTNHDVCALTHTQTKQVKV